MKDRRAGLDRLERIEDGRKILVLDVDEGQRLVRDVRIDGGDHGDLLADESHAIARQHRHVEHAAADQDIRKIRAVRTASTPASALARAVSIRTIRAWGNGLRRVLPQISRGGSHPRRSRLYR